MIKINKFLSNKDLSLNLAKYIVNQIKNKKNFILGCPSGRSLKNTYKFIGIISYRQNVDLSNVKIFMMDEFVTINKSKKYELCDKTKHYSCAAYSKNVIKKFFNYKKIKKKKLLDSNIFIPNVSSPKSYDRKIKSSGGIDIFLLASGSSDGHVAFNNIKPRINSLTHITKLSYKTRKDNMKTFSDFTSIKQVPKYGITVGLGTIHKLSKTGILVLSGKEKNKAAKIILKNKKYNSYWPASIIYKCKKKYIYIDKAAQTGL